MGSTLHFSAPTCIGCGLDSVQLSQGPVCQLSTSAAGSTSTRTGVGLSHCDAKETVTPIAPAAPRSASATADAADAPFKGPHRSSGARPPGPNGFGSGAGHDHPSTAASSRGPSHDLDAEHGLFSTPVGGRSPLLLDGGRCSNTSGSGPRSIVAGRRQSSSSGSPMTRALYCRGGRGPPRGRSCPGGCAVPWGGDGGCGGDIQAEPAGGGS